MNLEKVIHGLILRAQVAIVANCLLGIQEKRWHHYLRFPLSISPCLSNHALIRLRQQIDNVKRVISLIRFLLDLSCSPFTQQRNQSSAVLLPHMSVLAQLKSQRVISLLLLSLPAK